MSMQQKGADYLLGLIKSDDQGHVQDHLRRADLADADAEMCW